MDARTCILLVLVNIFQMVHHCSDSTDHYGVLFVFDSWEPDKRGLNGFHRNLIKEFLRRKEEQIKVYSTIVDTDVTDDILEDAKSLDVTLILPKQKGRMDSSTDKPRVEWLILHESYYPRLRSLRNIKFVVGYAPKTANAAAEIRDSLFRNAYLVVINHVIPDVRDSSYDFVTREKQMETWAAEANITFSIGPKIFEHFENVFRLEKLRKKPHKEYLPRPDGVLFQKNATLGNLKKLHVLFSYGKSDNGHELNNHDTFVNTVSEVQKNFQNMGKHPPEWKVSGSDTDIDNTLREAGVKCSKCTDQTTEVFADSLLQCDLYLITNVFSEYSFDGLEAIAVGIPVLAPRDSHIAWFFEEYFKEHEHRCVVDNIQHEWPRRITGMLADIVTAFKRAGDLMEEFNKSNDVCESHDRFAAIIKLKTNSSEKALPVKIEHSDQPYMEAVEQRKQHCQTIEQQEHTKDKAIPCDIQSLTQYKKEIDNLAKDNNKTIKKNVQGIVNNHEEVERITQISEKHSANLEEVDQGSLRLKLNFSCLLNLYNFEASCRSGAFAKDIEPLLITHEIIENSSKFNITPRLKALYDQENFRRIEKFFLERDGRIRKDLPTSPEIAIESDISLKDPRFVDYLHVHINLNQSNYNKKLEEYEQRQQCSSIERQQNTTDNSLLYILGLLRIMGIRDYMNDTLSHRIHAINGDEELFEKLKGVCLNSSANLIETDEEDFSLKFTFSSLFDLYRFESKCRLRRFADELEALLITGEMREKSDKVNIQPKLQVTYEQNNFKEIEDFFIQSYDEQAHTKTWIARDGADFHVYDQYSTNQQHQWIRWRWFINWIDPLYVTNLMFVVVIVVILGPSIKSGDGKIRNQREYVVEEDIFKEELTFHHTGAFLLERHDEIWKQELNLDWKTYITSANANNESLNQQYKDEIWPGFLQWIDPLYLMNLIFVIIVLVIFKPSVSTGNGILLLEVDTNKGFKPSHKKKLLRLFSAKLCTRYRTHSCDILELSVKVTEPLKKILRKRQNVLFLFGIKRYVVVKVGNVKLNIPGMMHHFKVHGRRCINSSSDALLCRSLSLSRKSTDLSTICLNMFDIVPWCSQNQLQQANSSLSTQKQLNLQLKKQISEYTKNKTDQTEQINSLNIQLKTKEDRIKQLQCQLKTPQDTIKTHLSAPDNTQPLDIPTFGKIEVRKEFQGLSTPWVVEKETGRGKKQFSFPTGVTWTCDGHLVVIDHHPNQLFILDSKYECIDNITFDNQFKEIFYPLNVSISNDNMYFLTDMYNEKITIYDKHSQTTRIMVDDSLGIKPFDICLMADSLYVTTINGDKLTRLGYDLESPDIVYRVMNVVEFNNAECWYVVVNSKRQILTSDYGNDCINVFDSDLTFLFSFGGTCNGQMSGPTGIDVDRKDNIYVCDCYNARIVKFSSDLKYYTCIDIDDEARPENISVSKDTWPPKIAVSDVENHCIWVLSMSEDSHWL
ncbi:uncharacterized protein LOC144440077 isoform X2 [Glandiceps talaboti]